MKKIEILIQVLAVFGLLFMGIYGLVKKTMDFPTWVYYVAVIPIAFAVILRITEMIVTYNRKKRS